MLPDATYPPSWKGLVSDTFGGQKTGEREELSVRFSFTTTVVVLSAASPGAPGYKLSSEVELLVGSAAVLPPHALEFAAPHCTVEAGVRYNTFCCCGGVGTVDYRIEMPHRVGLAGSSRAAGGLPLWLGAVAHGAPIAASAVYLKSHIVVSYKGATRTKAHSSVVKPGDLGETVISDTVAKLVLGSRQKQVPRGMPRSAGPLILDAVPLLPVFSKDLPPSFATGNILRSWSLVYEPDAAMCGTCPSVEVPIWVTNNPAAVPAAPPAALQHGPACTGAGKQ